MLFLAGAGERELLVNLPTIPHDRIVLTGSLSVDAS
jgi:hypothetical protein